MIAHVFGTVIARERGSIVVRSGDLGYRIYVTSETYERLSERSPVDLFTHLAIRENAHDLFGFETKNEHDFFELLLTVSGIGPKSALAILNLADVRTLSAAISSGDSSYLTKVSGIGNKSAAKIVVELKDKVGGFADVRDTHAIKGETDTLEALQALGYSLRESREALKKVEVAGENSSELIKAALKNLSRKG